MMADARSLMTLYRGWDGYQVALVRAVAPLSREQLTWQPAPHLRSVGEIAGHISQGRIHWFHRVLGEGSAELASRVAALRPADVPAIEASAGELVRWLEASWQMIHGALTRWTAADLDETVRQPYQGKTYAIPRQWIIWRVMSHDIHHGGELALALGMQGIAIPELGDQGGHLTEGSAVEVA